MDLDRRTVILNSAGLVGLSLEGTHLEPNHGGLPPAGRSSSNSGTVTPQYFGATADGVTDDWEAVQKAIDQVARNGGSLYFPRGRYRITRSIAVRIGKDDSWTSGFRIFGDGPGMLDGVNSSGSCIVPNFVHQAPAFQITGIPNTDNSHKGQINGLFIESLGIDGRLAPKCDGLQLGYLVNSTVQNVHVAHCNSGIVINRQANSSTFGYAHGILLNQVAVTACRGWGLKSVGPGSITVTLLSPNFSENGSGGVNLVGCPIVILGGGFFGNRGPALLHRMYDSRSDSFGPSIFGVRFESNGNPLSFKEDSGQIVLESFRNSSIVSSWFLSGSSGQNGIVIQLDPGSEDVEKVEIRGCRFDGIATAPRVSGIICSRRQVPFGLESCSFNKISVALRFFEDAELGAHQKGRAQRLLNSVRIGSSFFRIVDGKLFEIEL